MLKATRKPKPLRKEKDRRGRKTNGSHFPSAKKSTGFKSDCGGATLNARGLSGRINREERDSEAKKIQRKTEGNNDPDKQLYE